MDFPFRWFHTKGVLNIIPDLFINLSKDNIDFDTNNSLLSYTQNCTNLQKRWTITWWHYWQAKWCLKITKTVEGGRSKVGVCESSYEYEWEVKSWKLTSLLNPLVRIKIPWLLRRWCPSGKNEWCSFSKSNWKFWKCSFGKFKCLKFHCVY